VIAAGIGAQRKAPLVPVEAPVAPALTLARPDPGEPAGVSCPRGETL
jgi:hypothetical protein